MLTPSLESKQSGRPVTSSTHTQVNQAREQECLNAEVAIIAAAIADGFRTGIGVPELHARTVALIADIAAHAPRIGDYRRRLSNALAKLEAGDHRYLTAPDRDSYHTVWFELHQHLINLLGLTRQQEAAAGRAL
jgi:hypothetical protein